MFATIGRIFGGIIATALGVHLVIKTEWYLENFGTIEWAEQKFATSGGSRMFYKLIGIVIIMFGFLAATGMLNGFMMGTVGRLFGPPQQ
jgi:hypothetical protein